MTAQTYRILVLGDFHYGENYRSGADILRERGYSHSTRHLEAFVQASDYFIVNLETPIVDPEQYPSPLKGRKKYIHWADTEKAPEALASLGVDAVSLANNHILDHGAPGLQSTFDRLAAVGIPWFGAGENLRDATKPARVALPAGVGGGEVLFYGAFQYAKSHDREYGFYAQDMSPGCAPVSEKAIESSVKYEHGRDAFHIAFPHWGANYDWRTRGQYRIAQRYLRKGYNLVLGHGSHSVQEVLRARGRWVVYGIGNGNFQSAGRFKTYERENNILPISLWAVIEVQMLSNGEREIDLKLYPVYADNHVTDFQPGPVSALDFGRVVNELASRSPNAWRFSNSSQGVGVDDLGYYVSLELGSWKPEEAPANPKPLSSGNDPGDLPLRFPSPEIEDAITRLYRGYSLGPTLMAMAAERDGGTTHWLSGNRAVIEMPDRRLLVDGYIAHESSLGEMVCRNKEFTGRLLEQEGVPSPTSVPVTAEDEAVAAAASFGDSVVVKPVSGNKSRGVSVDVRGERDVREAFGRAKDVGSRVLVQQYIEVEQELRVLASPTESVAVNARVLPHVMGDGRSTIRQLINDKNIQRDLNPSLRNRPIPLDGATIHHLAQTGHSLESVLQRGETVTVRNVGGLGVGGETQQALESTEARVKKAAVDAVAAIPGLGWAGVDLILEKGTGIPYVIEINTRASYGAALMPSYGEPRDVASTVWRLRYAASSPESRVVPAPLRLWDHPVTIGHTLGLKAGGSSELRFSRILHDSLVYQGFRVHAETSQIYRVYKADGTWRWMTSEGLTEKDLSVVGQALRQHRVVRKLLAESAVPRTRAMRISTRRELERFVESRPGETVVAVPADAGWIRSEVLPVEELPHRFSIDEPRILQNRPSGTRVRVVARRERAMAAVSSDPDSNVDDRCMEVVGKLAVEAVRAVPELRWAVVDLVVRPQRIKEGRRGAALVEGLSLNPRLSQQDMVVAGDLQDFFTWLVET